MNPSEFINAANNEILRSMSIFEDVPEDSANLIKTDNFTDDDFADDDFTDDDFTDDDFTDNDFTDNDFTDDSIDESSVQESCPGIVSITIPVQEKEEVDTIYEEIKEFFKQHFIETEGISQDQLFVLWNSVYNDTLQNNDECVAEYLKLRYGLWFDNFVTMNFAVDQGLSFLKEFRMERRVCTKEDIVDVLEVASEEWFDYTIFSDLSNDSVLNSVIFEVMRKGLDVTKLYPFRSDSLILESAMKLLLLDRLDPLEFAKVADIGQSAVERYVKFLILEDVDRFAAIRGRDDFPKLYQMITTYEMENHCIRDEVIQRYAKAVYLDVIILAEAEERLDINFADAYLVDDLGDWDFIAKLYELNKIDLSLSRQSVVLAKILTDVKALCLAEEQFTQEHIKALKCLLFSRFKGNLSDVDYRKFLATVAREEGFTLTRLDESENMVESYNQFWFEVLLQSLDVAIFDVISDKIGDVVVYLQLRNQKLVPMYLQLDQFIFDRDGFLEIAGKASFGKVIAGEYGVILCDFDAITSNVFKGGFLCDSSLTTWANGKSIEHLANRFNADPIMSSNLIRAIYEANEKFIRDFEKTGEVANQQEKVHTNIKKFFALPKKEYFQVDKTLSFIVEHPEFLGLMKSSNVCNYLRCLARAYHFRNRGMLLFQFLSFIFNLYFQKKFTVYPAGFQQLNPESSVIFIKEPNGRIVTMGIQVLMDSLDSLLITASECSLIELNVETNTVNINFM